MAKKITGPRVATANRLQDGLVVFMDQNSDWTRNLNDAQVATSDAEVANLERDATAAAAANIIVDPYLIEVEALNGLGFVPVRNRERLRLNGPTVGTSLALKRRTAQLPADIHASAEVPAHVQI